MDRDKKTLSELAEAKRLLEEVGLRGEAEDAAVIQEKLKSRGPSREFETLYEIGQIINSILDLDVLLERSALGDD